MPRETTNPAPPQALGQSESFLRLQEQISRAARADRPVILIGERGTGKELAAARLHLLSARWGQPYVTLNCASLAPTLIESELFGHEAGSFTGALRARKGRFESAQGGSLFLDEVANIPLTVQEKILRTVEYGQMERVGSSQTMTVDVRLIAATHENLLALVEAGRFRRDLLDRLAFEVVTLPPLRARREDIALLAGHFARRMAAELGRAEPPRFSERAERALLDYNWPGNIRELKNVVERMVYRHESDLIDTIQFDPFASEYAPAGTGQMAPLDGVDGVDGMDNMDRKRRPDASASSASSVSSTSSIMSRPSTAHASSDLDRLPLAEAIDALERRRVAAALEACRYNQRRAAEALGLTYDQFRRLYRKHRQQMEPANRANRHE
jgi:psp operon transcriptional activator